MLTQTLQALPFEIGNGTKTLQELWSLSKPSSKLLPKVIRFKKNIRDWLSLVCEVTPPHVVRPIPACEFLPLAPGLPWSTIKRRPFHCSFSLLLFSLPKNCHFASLSLFSGSKFSFDSICFRKITQQMTYTGNFFVVLLVITPALSIFFGKVVTFNILYISYSHFILESKTSCCNSRTVALTVTVLGSWEAEGLGSVKLFLTMGATYGVSDTFCSILLLRKCTMRKRVTTNISDFFGGKKQCRDGAWCVQCLKNDDCIQGQFQATLVISPQKVVCTL